MLTLKVVLPRNYWIIELCAAEWSGGSGPVTLYRVKKKCGSDAV